MRATEFITELTGYKKDPLYSILQNSENISQFVENLKANGYTQLVIGEGMFGAAFRKEGEPWIVKIWEHDPAYEIYLNYVLQNQNNPHVPKIYGKPLKIMNKFRLARMELLDNANPYGLGRPGARSEMENYVQTGNIEFAPTIFETWPSLKPVLDFIHSKIEGSYSADMHSGNVLWRGNDPVVIDPLCDTDLFESEQLDELQGYRNNPVFNVLRNSTNIDEFTDGMANCGYRSYHLGTGSFGAVFERPGSGEVIKVWQRDKAYESYIAFALEHQDNPHVPRIIGKPTRILSGKYRFMRLKKLQKMPRTDENRSLIYALQSAVSDSDPNASMYYDSIVKQFPEMSEVINFITSSKYYADIGSNNVMVDENGTLIITDPLADFSKPTVANESEQLDELKGYREDPLFKLLANSRNLNDFRVEMMHAGYTQYLMGTGAYGMVFKRGNEPYVIKIWGNDPGYDSWVAYALAHQNSPYVPKIVGKPMKILNGKFKVMRIEKLQNGNFSIRKEAIAREIGEYATGRGSYGQRLIKNYPGLKPVLDYLKTLANNHGAYVDIRTNGNILWREDTPVISDPLVMGKTVEPSYADLEPMEESLGPDYPGTYEQENELVRTKGKQVNAPIAFENKY